MTGSASGAPVAADEPIEIRVALDRDAEGLAALFRTVYGETYDHDWAYDPDAMRARWNDGEMRSVVGVTHEEEIVGHLALDFDRPGARVGESGQALVDPRWRGHHLFESMKSYLAERATADGLYGMYSEATAVHPYSQKGGLALGAHETGFLIGFIPSGVDYKGISGEAPHRETAALMYLRTNPEPRRVSHLPEHVRDLAGDVYANGGYARDLGGGEGANAEGATELETARDASHNIAIIRLRAAGPDLHEVVAAESALLTADGVDCIYLSLPCAWPESAAYADGLGDLGFFYACIIPERRDDGDVLWLQRLNGVEPHAEEIATASDFGRDLLARILAQHT